MSKKALEVNLADKRKTLAECCNEVLEIKNSGSAVIKNKSLLSIVIRLCHSLNS